MKHILYILLPLLLLCGCSSDEPAPAPDRNSRSKEDLRKIELYKEYGYFFIDVIDGNPYDAGPLGERGAHFYREVKAEGETAMYPPQSTMWGCVASGQSFPKPSDIHRFLPRLISYAI